MQYVIFSFKSYLQVCCLKMEIRRLEGVLKNRKREKQELLDRIEEIQSRFVVFMSSNHVVLSLNGDKEY